MSFSFLNINPDINKAHDLNESPHAVNRITPQIQLLSYDPQPYTQVTNGTIELSVASNYEVFLVKCNSSVEYDVTEHVQITNYNGQLIVRLAYLPYDFHITPVYLKIKRGAVLGSQGFYYSNKFILTRYNEHLTSRLDYFERDRTIKPEGTIQSESGIMQSIRLQFYFNNLVDATEVETYYQITTSQTVNPRVSIKEYNQWQTQLFNGWALSRLANALYDRRCYINQVRNYIIEGFERAEREAQSNISENTFLTDPDEKDTIHIIPVIIGPDWQTIPFLSSSSQPSSTSFLSSQSTITTPI